MRFLYPTILFWQTSVEWDWAWSETKGLSSFEHITKHLHLHRHSSWPSRLGSEPWALVRGRTACKVLWLMPDYFDFNLPIIGWLGVTRRIVLALCASSCPFHHKLRVIPGFYANFKGLSSEKRIWWCAPVIQPIVCHMHAALARLPLCFARLATDSLCED